MSWDNDFSVRNLDPGEDRVDRRILEEFLQTQGLSWEEDIDYTIGFFREEKLAAAASLAGSIIKGVAVDSAFRGENLTSRLITYLKLNAHHRGIHSLFIFTGPENRAAFESLGFSRIAETEEVVLLEDNTRNFRTYLQELGDVTGLTDVAAVVVNCNPFTLGHRYLIEKAAAENDHLIVFVVEEDLSAIPFPVRLELVKQGTGDLVNVKVIPAGKYIISQATFPSYFLKDEGRVNEVHARLDLEIFSSSIAPAAGIRRRYVGEEPFCAVTSMYNRLMKEILPARGIEVIEIPRKEFSGTAISASEVRRRLIGGNLAGVDHLVPQTTLAYFTSGQGRALLETLKGNAS